MALRSIDSVDVQIWAGPNALDGGTSFDGLQMADYRGVTWGVMTQDNGGSKDNQGKIWAVALTEDKKWNTKAWIEVKGVVAKGRVSVTVLDDRFYIAFRGLKDNKVYVLRTEDFVNFYYSNPDNFTTTQTPAIAAYRGWLVLTAVGGTDSSAANTIYQCWMNPNTYGGSWSSLFSSTTRKGLSMTVYRDQLYAFHTSADSTQIRYFRYYSKWYDVTATKASIASGPSSASFRDNMMYVTYRGPDGNIKWNRYDGSKWQCTNGVNWRFALGELGLVSFNTRLHLSYAEGTCMLNEPPKKLEWVDMPQEKRETTMWDSDCEEELEDLKVLSPVKSEKRRSWWRCLLCFT